MKKLKSKEKNNLIKPKKFVYEKDEKKQQIIANAKQKN